MSILTALESLLATTSKLLMQGEDPKCARQRRHHARLSGLLFLTHHRSMLTHSCVTWIQGIPKEKIPSVRVSGDIVLGTFGFQPGAFWADMARLVLLLGFFLTATFMLLKYRRQP